MYRMTKFNASLISSARCNDIQTMKLIEQFLQICSRHVLTDRVLAFFLQVRHATSPKPYELPTLLLVTPPCPRDNRPTTEANSSTKMVASLVGWQHLDDGLEAMCCSLHTQYFSIHSGAFSIDDELADEVRDRRSPSRHGSSGDGVGDDMAPRDQSRWGSREAVRGRIGLDGGGGDRAQGRWQGRGLSEAVGTVRDGVYGSSGTLMSLELVGFI
jgi:hypothetical protein